MISQMMACDVNIISISDIIRRPRCLISGRIPDRRNLISILVAKNLNLASFAFKKYININCVNKRVVLKLQHQWGLKNKYIEDLSLSKVNRTNRAKTIEA